MDSKQINITVAKLAGWKIEVRKDPTAGETASCFFVIKPDGEIRGIAIGDSELQAAGLVPNFCKDWSIMQSTATIIINNKPLAFMNRLNNNLKDFNPLYDTPETFWTLFLKSLDKID